MDEYWQEFNDSSLETVNIVCKKKGSRRGLCSMKTEAVMIQQQTMVSYRI